MHFLYSEIHVRYRWKLFIASKYIVSCRSLPNLSNDIRWSIDLRWQRCDLPVAFHGLKEGVRFRSSVDPAHKIDWSPLETNASVDDAIDVMTKVRRTCFILISKVV